VYTLYTIYPTTFVIRATGRLLYTVIIYIIGIYLMYISKLTETMKKKPQNKSKFILFRQQDI